MYVRSSENIYHDIPCRTIKYKNSFFPNAIKTWNCLTENIQACTNLNHFIFNLISLVRPKPKSRFGIYDPTGIIYLFQLRVKLCRLRYHKKCYSFADTPSGLCACLGGIEDHSFPYLLSIAHWTKSIPCLKRYRYRTGTQLNKPSKWKLNYIYMVMKR